MKKIEKGSIKYLVILIVMVSLFGMILYPLFDLLFCKFITKSKFVYSEFKHIVQPITFGIIYGITFWILDKKRK